MQVRAGFPNEFANNDSTTISTLLNKQETIFRILFPPISTLFWNILQSKTNHSL